MSYLFHYLNTLSENSMNLPVFHWFRVIGFWAAGGCAVVWFATSRSGMDARWQVLTTIAGWMALFGLVAWAIGWLAGILILLLLLLVVLLLVASVALVVVLYQYIGEHF